MAPAKTTLAKKSVSSKKSSHKHSAAYPQLLVATKSGDIFEIPELAAAGMAGDRLFPLDSQLLLELPCGSDLFILPDRKPIGYDPVQQKCIPVDTYQGEEVFAVGAFMAPAYVQLATAAYEESANSNVLPLFAYTAAAFTKKGFVVAGMRIDKDSRQDLDGVDLDKVARKAHAVRKKYSGNRLVEHLVDDCVFRYGCPAARNLVLGRYECPVPISTSCNAACLGCISEQPCGSGIKAAHDRMTFVPTVKEIVEFTVHHLETADRPVISFGQGCEGEPLLFADLIEESIIEIRKQTKCGVINLNTNGSLPHKVERLCAVGLDSIRVSLSSARKACYTSYYRPKGYDFDDVMQTLCVAHDRGLFSSINYFMLPGFTDLPSELAALEILYAKSHFSMIQTRNLNIDPLWYGKEMGEIPAQESPLGMAVWVAYMRKNYSQVKLGYFNPPRSEMMP